MAFPLMTGFLFSALTVPWNLLGCVDLWLMSMKGSLMAAMSTTVPELKAAPVFSPLCVRAEAGSAAGSAQEGPESCSFSQERLP